MAKVIVEFRIESETREQIDDVVEDDPRFDSRSQFIRVAVRELLSEHDQVRSL